MDENRWVSSTVLQAAGVDRATIWRKTKAREWEWQWSKGRGRPHKVISVSSLPEDIRLRIADYGSETGKEPLHSLATALKRIPVEERDAWANELTRLGQLMEQYAATNPKRVARNGRYEYVPAVRDLCESARCTDSTLLAREPRRAEAPSPRTLDEWSRRYQKQGLAAFLRSSAAASPSSVDRRQAAISKAAVEWVNANWRSYRSPRALFEKLREKAKSEGWTIPSYTWVYRRWRQMPATVRTLHLEGQSAYVSKLAPYCPRDNSELDALQVLCGDHSERDVTVVMPDGKLKRPWLTVWQCLRTGLLWGWHLDLVPSSRTAGLAYADGVQRFGAQPLSRPEDGFYSYVYTDQGKDYKSHAWDGAVIEIHKQAMALDGRFAMVRVQRRVGLLDELGVKHLLARGYNAREKPVERVFKDISYWEANTFEEYFGPHPKARPDRWRELYRQHQKAKKGESPFIGFDEYREALAGWIASYNVKPHERTWLNGARIIPLEEHNRLYTTRYEISEESLALLLMKSVKRQIGKNGVTLFRRGWWYLHKAMSEFKTRDVEVCYDDADYNRVWVVLPDGRICEADRLRGGPVTNPNRAALKTVKEVERHERKVNRDYLMIRASAARGESVEDRVAAQLEQNEEIAEPIAVNDGPRVHRLTRMDRPKLRAEVAPAVSVDAIRRARESSDSGEFSLRLVEPIDSARGTLSSRCKCGKDASEHEFDGDRLRYGGCVATGCDGFRRR